MDLVGLALSSPLGSKERSERLHLPHGQLNSCKDWHDMSSSQVKIAIWCSFNVHMHSDDAETYILMDG